MRSAFVLSGRIPANPDDSRCQIETVLREISVDGPTASSTSRYGGTSFCLSDPEKKNQMRGIFVAI